MDVAEEMPVDVADEMPVDVAVVVCVVLEVGGKVTITSKEHVATLPARSAASIKTRTSLPTPKTVFSSGRSTMQPDSTGVASSRQLLSVASDVLTNKAGSIRTLAMAGSNFCPDSS